MSYNKGYHLNKIPKFEFGTPLKIYEEMLEFIDAIEQECYIMAWIELSDLLGAVKAVYPEVKYAEFIGDKNLIELKFFKQWAEDFAKCPTEMIISVFLNAA